MLSFLEDEVDDGESAERLRIYNAGERGVVSAQSPLRIPFIGHFHSNDAPYARNHVCGTYLGLACLNIPMRN